MAKLTNVRERVHQAVSDALVRTSGEHEGSVQDETSLFQGSGLLGASNIARNGALPADQSMCVLAVRALCDFRIPTNRGNTVVVAGGTNYPQTNGDVGVATTGLTAPQSNVTRGNAPASMRDAVRLYMQAQDQLFWSIGFGLKPSLSGVPLGYFPFAGGYGSGATGTGFPGAVPGDFHGERNMPVVLTNGIPDNRALCRLARAILLPPRQNFDCTARIQPPPDGGNNAIWQGTQGTRNMVSLKDNLNAPDLMQKVIIVSLDGLISRDVQ